MNAHEHVNYVEFPAKDLEAAKKFFMEAFGWSFTDYGPDYMDVSDVGVSIGFHKADKALKYDETGTLVVLYSKALEETQAKIEKAGGKIVKPVFAFPGGRRFHFADPNGNEYGVWSDL